MTRIEILWNRVEGKKRTLENRLATLAAASLAETAQERELLQAKLTELQQTLGRGWQSVNDAAAVRLTAWLKD